MVENEQQSVHRDIKEIKIKFQNMTNVEQIVNDFCKINKIDDSDEFSLMNYILCTLETEKISYDVQVIVQMIQEEFQTNDILKML